MDLIATRINGAHPVGLAVTPTLTRRDTLVPVGAIFLKPYAMAAKDPGRELRRHLTFGPVCGNSEALLAPTAPYALAYRSGRKAIGRVLHYAN